jgi:hypothetical protein
MSPEALGSFVSGERSSRQQRQPAHGTDEAIPGRRALDIRGRVHAPVARCRAAVLASWAIDDAGPGGGAVDCRSASLRAVLPSAIVTDGAFLSIRSATSPFAYLEATIACLPDGVEDTVIWFNGSLDPAVGAGGRLLTVVREWFLRRSIHRYVIEIGRSADRRFDVSSGDQDHRDPDDVLLRPVLR